jgi:UDP-N-acetylmuramate: L-alanyl-gamma-D-glutamyl-meso-diaminopimelate ligase
MRSGVHKDTLGEALSAADAAWVYRSASIEWDIGMLEQTPGVEIRVSDDIDALIAAVSGQSAGGDHVLVMSNSGFEGFHQRLLDALAERQR